MWQLLKRYFMPEYLSPLDQFLTQFDKTHLPSASQQKEIARYRLLYESCFVEKPSSSATV